MIRFFSPLVLFIPLSLVAQDATLVAPGEALKPEAQRALFHLPDGFEIQLVASEPSIGQPLNLRFDAAGRLWVTSSVEYPYPANGPGVEPREETFAGADPPHEPRDTLTVLSDFGEDGLARSVTKFATGLNIPIGHLPMREGTLVYSIPSLKCISDTDGDGQADSKEVLLTGFGNVDTHGMINGLRRGFDGWIYACHGFRNTSTVKGTDGSTLNLNSGNIFRFRPDGSQLEQVAWGQVNPFGLSFDPRGDLYSADCHSMPLTCVLRGSYYPSFGKPHGGLGFGPTMINHSHGSTGICGPAYYAATHFPEEYRDNLFLCNPVTGRVHRDKLTWSGSSPEAETQPDFVTSEDGWFRPVDLAVGPDGALYIADFYNAVIGHYEVPLDHPKRDRTNGRIWRVIYTGGDADAVPPASANLTAASNSELVEYLGDSNLTVRLLATNELADRFSDEAGASDQVPTLIHQIIAGEAPRENIGEVADAQRAHAMWVSFRLGDLTSKQLEGLANDESPLVRVHVALLLGERAPWTEEDHTLALGLLNDEDEFVQRAAVAALGRRGTLEDHRLLLDHLRSAPQDDSHLRHATRIALKLIFSRASDLDAVALDELSPADRVALASILPAVTTEAGAVMLAHFVERDMRDAVDVIPDGERPTAVGHVFRHGPADAGDRLIGLIRADDAMDLDQRLALLEAARAARVERNVPKGAVLTEWARELVVELFEASAGSADWSQASAGDGPTWTVQRRASADGESALFWSSLPSGEQRTGALRSRIFAMPETFVFYLAGHAGFPKMDAHSKNVVRLHDAASGAVLREALPPRNDVAQRVEWPLRELAGGQGYLELVDGDTGGSYAWLAAGRFNVEAMRVSPSVPIGKASEMVAVFQLQDLRPMLMELLANDEASIAARAAAASAAAGLDEKPILVALAPLVGDPSLPVTLREAIVGLFAEPDAEPVMEILISVVKNRSSAGQQVLAERLAETTGGSRALLAIIEQGHASPRLLTRPGVQQRLAAHQDTEWKSRIDALTSDLPAEDAALNTLIEERVRAYDPSSVNVERGAALFEKHCGNCHQIGSEGSLVGPQLDGIGVRGLERMAEDILDPNRNVDGAFRTSTLVMTDGRVLTGLVRREAGESLVLADNQGKEFSVPQDEIEERVASSTSLMPANMGEVVTPEQLADLLAYLLTQRTPAAP